MVFSYQQKIKKEKVPRLGWDDKVLGVIGIKFDYSPYPQKEPEKKQHEPLVRTLFGGLGEYYLGRRDR